MVYKSFSIQLSYYILFNTLNINAAEFHQNMVGTRKKKSAVTKCGRLFLSQGPENNKSEYLSKSSRVSPFYPGICVSIGKLFFSKETNGTSRMNEKRTFFFLKKEHTSLGVITIFYVLWRVAPRDSSVVARCRTITSASTHFVPRWRK